MPIRRLTMKALVAGLALVTGLTGSVVVMSKPAQAQLVMEPEALSVTLPQGETEARTVTLRNTGSEPLAFCVNFDRPLQRAVGAVQLANEALGGACGTYGEVLFLVNRSGLPGCCASAHGLTMTPDGRLFAAEYHTDLTYELNAELGFVRAFDHPVVAELAPFPVTTGLTYNADTGTLWWLNIEEYTDGFRRALLLEGDLNGVPTGRRIELPIGADGPPDERVNAVGLVYDPATELYYYLDFSGDRLWAVDTLGVVAEGYPVELEAYPGAQFGFGLDAHSTSEDAAGLRFEVGTALPPQPGVRRIVVAEQYGGDTAPEAEPLVTPLSEPLPGTDSGGMGGEPVRSRTDPNGVLYYPYSGFGESGVVAIRPHPLPPSWLVVEAWDGTLAPGESRQITLTFRPGARAVGTYTATLQAFTAETGEAVEVPLTLEVMPGTVSEEEPAEVPEASLAVYPNPTNASAMVALTLGAASEVRVAVYDVLGRRVALLSEGALDAGTHRLRFDGRALPAGLYLVRAESGSRSFTERITLVR